MELSLADALGLTGLVAIALRLGWLVHKRSVSKQPIHGGMPANLFNYLSAACFAAILPTVLMMVIILHPDNVQLAGIVWHPLILAVIALGLGSLAFAMLHAFFEYGPMTREMQQEATRAARGWTEEDAKSSGL